MPRTRSDVLASVVGVLTGIVLTSLTYYWLDRRHADAEDVDTTDVDTTIANNPYLAQRRQSQTAQPNITIDQQELQRARITLHDALLKIFKTVDKTQSNRITSKAFTRFVKQLGLTGDREIALLQVVGFGNNISATQSSSDTQAPAKPGHRRSKSRLSCDDGNDEDFVTYEEFIQRFEGTFNESEASAEQSSDLTPRSLSRPGSIHTPPAMLSTPSAVNRPVHNSQRRPSVSVLPSTRQSLNIHVFLGGTCGASTWRATTAMPMLDANQVTYYNPQVQEWNPNLVCLETLMKAWCKVLLFVIDGTARSCASMVEAAALLADGRNIVLVLHDLEPATVINGHAVGVEEAKDINRGRKYLMELADQYEVEVFKTVEDACQHIIDEAVVSRQEAANQRADSISMSTDGASHLMYSPMAQPTYYSQQKRSFVFHNSTDKRASLRAQSVSYPVSSPTKYQHAVHPAIAKTTITRKPTEDSSEEKENTTDNLASPPLHPAKPSVIMASPLHRSPSSNAYRTL